MARNDPQINFRVSADLKKRLEDAAEKNNRSITAELTSRIESSFDFSGRESAIEEIKAMLIERDRSLFEESVNAALERFKKELLSQK